MEVFFCLVFIRTLFFAFVVVSIDPFFFFFFFFCGLSDYGCKR